ncbi:MAG TPA: STAS domain-containing protein, partial [Phycisphaerales bacterium]|nr:STAS domain-containing protein [Phycisphaerales bacterium]
QAFWQRLAGAMPKSRGRLVLDAAAIPFVDSAGLEALVQAAEELAESGQTLKLCGVGETLREVLDLTELSGLFEYFADVGDATRSFL